MASSTQQDGGAASPAPPQRRRIQLTAEAMDSALQMANNGKVTSKNAWDVKVLEGMEGNMEQLLGESNEEQDQYKQFQKAATVVEGGAKVWTYRVENIHSLSNQMLQRLLRNDTRVVEEDENGENADGEGQVQRQRKKKTLERTIATNKSEIDLDSKQQAAGSEAVSAMFRAMTEKFDQSHSQGLLLNNCPMGTAGNIILDRNLAQDQGEMLDLEYAPIPVDDIPLARASQQIKDSPTLKIPYSHPADAEVNTTMGANTRASSVASQLFGDRSRRTSPGRMDNGDDDGDNGDFGGGDFDDYEEGEEDDVPGADLSRVGSVARGLVSGRTELDELDKLALMVENLNEWVPLTETAASSQSGGALKRNVAGVPQSQLLTDIRRKCALPKAPTAGTQAQVGQKRTRTGKTVSFAAQSQAANEDENNRAEDPNANVNSLLVALKMNKNKDTALLPFGRQLTAHANSTDDFMQASHCEKQARAQPARAPLIFTKQMDVLEAKRNRHQVASANSGYKNASQTLRGEAPRDASDAEFRLNHFFQPFSAAKPHWNILKKTARQMQPEMANITRFHQGADGNYEEVDEEIGVMPPDIFEGDMGFDNDGDDDDFDLEAPAFNIPLDMTDLPDLDGDGAANDGLKLIEGPEIINALKLNRATVPTQVDVARLRSCMWNATTKLVAPPGAEEEVQNEVDEDSENPDRVKIDPDAKNTFCSVVADTLPSTAQFSKDGSLSPAFFFFSLLFLANEHGLELKSSADDSLADILITRATK